MEKTAEPKTTRKATRRARKPKAITPALAQEINASIDLIEAKAQDHIDSLVNELTQGHGLKLPKAGHLTYTATMHGITGGHGGIVRVALTNWAKAARRALLRGEI